VRLITAHLRRHRRRVRAGGATGGLDPGTHQRLFLSRQQDDDSRATASTPARSTGRPPLGPRHRRPEEAARPRLCDTRVRPQRDPAHPWPPRKRKERGSLAAARVRPRSILAHREGIQRRWIRRPTGSCPALLGGEPLTVTTAGETRPPRLLVPGFAWGSCPGSLASRRSENAAAASPPPWSRALAKARVVRGRRQLWTGIPPGPAPRIGVEHSPVPRETNARRGAPDGTTHTRWTAPAGSNFQTMWQAKAEATHCRRHMAPPLASGRRPHLHGIDAPHGDPLPPSVPTRPTAIRRSHGSTRGPRRRTRGCQTFRAHAHSWVSCRPVHGPHGTPGTPPRPRQCSGTLAPPPGTDPHPSVDLQQ
jgi:hypothetical protein